MKAALPRYRLPTRPLSTMLGSFLTLEKRNFRSDAIALIQGIEPNLMVHGRAPELPMKGLVVLVNHYNRPGFQAWWIALAVSSALDFDLHWVVTSGWVYDDFMRSLLITPISRWLLRKITFCYGFTSMPAMPPRPEETGQRAAAALSLVRYAKNHSMPLIGLAPEGYDSETGQLQRPPDGVGRLLFLLAACGLKWLPAGVYEEHGSLNLRFGPVIDPNLPDRRQPNHDRVMSDQAMTAIAHCLPDRLRGPYSLN
jgi:hypothetical protein